MTKQALKKSFDSMIEVLKLVPNVSEDMLKFDGSAQDIENLGYFYYEGVLPTYFDDNLDAGRYVLGNVLEHEFGFEWVETGTGACLAHPRYGLRVELASITPNEFYAIDESFDGVRTAIARKQIHG